MPVSKKPRKKYRQKQEANIPGILMPHQKDNLALPVYACLARAKIGLADEEDFHTVSACLNVALVVAMNKGDLPNTVALLAQAAEVMNYCKKDLNSLNENQLETVGLAVNMADEINNHVQPDEFKKAVATVMQFTSEEPQDVVFHESV